MVFAVLVTSVLVLLQQQGLLIDQRNRAEAVADWMVSLFELSDPGHALGQEITVREVLDHSSKTIRDDLADDPQLLHQMLTVLGQTYFNIGLSSEAGPLISDALGIARGLGSSDQQLDNLLLLSTIYYSQGNYLQAAELADEAVGISRTLSTYDPRIPRSLIAKALAATAFSRQEEALKLHEEAEAMARAHNDSETLATTLGYSSEILVYFDQYERAEQNLREAHALRATFLPENHPVLLKTRIQLTALKTSAPSKMPPLRELVRQFKKLYRGDGERSVSVLKAAAAAAARAELLDESKELYEEVLKISRAAWGKEHLDSVIASCAIAQIHYRKGELTTAESMYGDALPMVERILGEDSIQEAVILSQLARIDLRQGRLEQAEARLLAALVIIEETGISRYHRRHLFKSGNHGA